MKLQLGKVQLQVWLPVPRYTQIIVPWLQLQIQSAEVKARQSLQFGVRELLQEGCASQPMDVYAAHMLAMVCHVQQHTVHLLLLMQHSPDAAEGLHGCLVQCAVGPRSTEQAAMVVSAAVQHCQ